MNKDEILQELVEIIDEHMIDIDDRLDDFLMGVESEEVTREMRFIDDLDIDSLSAVQIATCVEEHFDIKISNEALGLAVTVGQAVDYIWQALQSKTQEVLTPAE